MSIDLGIPRIGDYVDLNTGTIWEDVKPRSMLGQDPLTNINIWPTSKLLELRRLRRSRYGQGIPTLPADYRLDALMFAVEPKLGGYLCRSATLQVKATAANEEDGHRWLHVEATHGDHTLVSWDELTRVKQEFVGPDKWAYQVFPPTKNYVNRSEVLHLWHRLDNAAVLPQFWLMKEPSTLGEQ